MKTRNSYAVMGIGRFGTAVALELSKMGADVLVIDDDEDRIHAIAEFVTCAVKADISDAEALTSLGLANMDGVIVAMTRNLDASILGTIIAKECGVPFVIAKAQDEMHAKILRKVGADRVIVPEKESGVRIARNLVNGNFLEFFELSDSISVVEIPVREEWIGKNLMELDFRKKFKINVIAVDAVDEELVVNIMPDMPLRAGTMWITGDIANVAKMAE
ncbi:MAG: TrkA family potassium uptake protein [Lachnospiraceae bacterium]